jgi:hypothetical protein
MHVGFMVAAHGGEVEFQLFGADRPGRPPLVQYTADGDCRAVLMGRLYYRQELLARWGQAGDGPEPDDDASLALAAYRHEGLEGVERLEGDFALVIWDSSERRLIASRDVMGGYPICWVQQGETIAFATGLRPLVDLLPGRALNVDFLGEVLMLPNFEIDYFEGTTFEGSGGWCRAGRSRPTWRAAPSGSASSGNGLSRSRAQAASAPRRSRPGTVSCCGRPSASGCAAAWRRIFPAAWTPRRSPCWRVRNWPAKADPCTRWR